MTGVTTPVKVVTSYHSKELYNYICHEEQKNT